MIGAILGDIVGSPYEFDQGEKIKDFGPLFSNDSCFTDAVCARISGILFSMRKRIRSMSGYALRRLMDNRNIKMLKD